MTESNSSGNGANPTSTSDGSTKRFKDKKKSKEQPVLGALEAFGSLI